LQRELDSLVYRNPEGEWETADRYLSGDVRAKLKTAEAAAVSILPTAATSRP
jgi:N12 class adenine-specific DNA methylase